MTINTETQDYNGVQGDLEVEIVTLDITSLDSSGFEPYTPNEVEDPYGASVIDQENPGYVFGYDVGNGRVTVQYADYDATGDGTLIDVPSTTDVGEVTLKFEGQR